MLTYGASGVMYRRNNGHGSRGLRFRDGKITALYIVRNPDKLRHVEAMLAE